MKTDPRIDAYIAKAGPFAHPILTHLRGLVHEALPEAEEGIKWGMPHWMVGGKNVAGMSAFKAHCAFVIHGSGRQGADQKEGMGGYGKVATLSDLPPRAELIATLRAAAEHIAQAGSTTPAKSRPQPKPEIAVPDDFAEALKGNPAAQAALDRFAPSHRREYLEWITEGKRAETRAKRIAQAVEWLAEGKKRNWKYENC
jgi:uncharacterized protein YdeI (YjbR/CyaY-like superfamily)